MRTSFVAIACLVSMSAGVASAQAPASNVVKSDGLFLRGKSNDVLTAERLGLNVRDEYRINARTFVFGQNQYLRDEFKNIDYLLAPTGRIGYKI